MARLTEVGVLLLVVGVICAAAQEEPNPPEQKDMQKFFVRSVSTTTETVLTSITSIVPFLCFFTGAAPAVACQGRRLRRSRQISLNLGSPALSPDLDYGSLDVNPQEMEKEEVTDEKFFFTLYKSVTTTATITTTSINSSTTVSVSAYCTFAGFTGPVC
ncbi:uncharacterized protein LOC121858105 [Homarus americanus]|uniref:uncharacterized protein LOC121858105 n=1 Tax=Homarus americanus TaxID=6706 RepID=UPI001C44A83E|nr:uncharacterized protein LOC121858105 [Homarus americanus]